MGGTCLYSKIGNFKLIFVRLIMLLDTILYKPIWFDQSVSILGLLYTAYRITRANRMSLDGVPVLFNDFTLLDL